jgi:hypothetical protein
MRKFLNESWDLVRLFPFSSYAICLALLEIFLRFTQTDTNGGATIFFYLLSYPARLVMTFFDFNFLLKKIPQIYILFIFVFLLDLLLFSLRTGSLKNLLKKTYHKFTKPKK